MTVDIEQPCTEDILVIDGLPINSNETANEDIGRLKAILFAFGGLLVLGLFVFLLFQGKTDQHEDEIEEVKKINEIEEISSTRTTTPSITSSTFKRKSEIKASPWRAFLKKNKSLVAGVTLVIAAAVVLAYLWPRQWPTRLPWRPKWDSWPSVILFSGGSILLLVIVAGIILMANKQPAPKLDPTIPPQQPQPVLQQKGQSTYTSSDSESPWKTVPRGKRPRKFWEPIVED